MSGSLYLALTELDLFQLQRFALTAQDSLGAAITLAERLFKVLRLLSLGNYASLLHFAGKPTQEVLDRFLRIFTGNLYHAGYCTLTEIIMQTLGG